MSEDLKSVLDYVVAQLRQKRFFSFSTTVKFKRELTEEEKTLLESNVGILAKAIDTSDLRLEFKRERALGPSGTFKDGYYYTILTINLT